MTLGQGWRNPSGLRRPVGLKRHATAARTALACALALAFVTGNRAQYAQPRRIISLVPALTEMLIAMGAGPRLVGVSNFDRTPASSGTPTRVGGLLDPNVELILSLRPDLVIVYGTQLELRQQLGRAHIPIFSYQHGGLADITRTVRDLGHRIGSTEAADRLAQHIERDVAAIRERVKTRPRPRTLLVFGREPGTLRGVQVSGGVGFLHDMLEAAGGRDVFADIKRESVQATTESILARAPEAIIELRYEGDLSAREIERERRSWEALPALPAVRLGHIYLLVGDEFVVPGPRVAGATEKMARALHPEAFR